jgi:hypothetical protein
VTGQSGNGHGQYDKGACQSFLAEPKVLEAEAGLRRYWKAFNKRGEDSVGTFDEWRALCRQALESMTRPHGD